MMKQLCAAVLLFWFVLLLGGCAFASKGHVDWDLTGKVDIPVVDKAFDLLLGETEDADEPSDG